MKRFILPIIILLMALTLMSSGSLAIYTQQRELRGRLYTRVFLFDTKEKSTSYDLGLAGLALEPGGKEKELYRFELTNADSSSVVSDYSIEAAVESAGMSEALAGMKGLVFRLYDVSNENSTPIMTVTSGEMKKSGIIFRAGMRQTLQYKLCAEWVDNGDSLSQTAAASSGARYTIGLTVTATGLD